MHIIRKKRRVVNMFIAGLILISLVLFSLFQIWLSTRVNGHFGLILPVINLFISAFLAMMTSDFLTTFLVFTVSASPVLLWFWLLKKCQIKLFI